MKSDPFSGPSEDPASTPEAGRQFGKTLITPPSARAANTAAAPHRRWPGRVVTVLIIMFAAGSTRADLYKDVLERKYEAELERLEVISFSPTTKVLWFDWQRSWWGGFNVIETDEDGRPLYWHDIVDGPSAQSIERVRVVTLSGKNYLEVIDCTHMGNGMLYLYEIRAGFVRRKLRARVMANFSVHFAPRLANVAYRDLDQDGDDDVVVEASCLEGQVIDGLDKEAGKYYREFLFQTGDFREQREKRIGRDELMD